MFQLDISELGRVTSYKLAPSNKEEGNGLALTLGSLVNMAKMEQGPLIRIHSCCLFGDALGSIDCDCAAQLKHSKKEIASEGQGIIFYLTDHEGRGAGLATKIEGYTLSQTYRIDTVEAYKQLNVTFDSRQYGHCTQFLKQHEITKVRLLTNNPSKVGSLTNMGIQVMRIPLIVGINNSNKEYLRVKRDKAAHLFSNDL